MGKPRYIYFQDSIDKQLQKVGNKSALINSLLEEYFRKEDFRQLSPEELRIKIAKAKLKKEYESKLKEVKNG